MAKGERSLAGRDVFIPRDFVDALREHVKGFVDEPERNQWGLAYLAWVGTQKRRQHATEPGSMTFSGEELERLFGRGKTAAVLERIDFFQRSPGWIYNKGITRAYWFSAEVRNALGAYAKRPVEGAVDQLWLSGERIKVARTLPRAISSTDTNGRVVRTSDWDAAAGLNKIPVNTDMLRALRRWADQCLNDKALAGQVRLLVERIRDLSAKVLRMSATTLAGPGHIQQVYSISPSGRLYGGGVSLQNVPRLVKDAALHGMWEYDFSNCHFTLVAQMAKRVGTPCPAIQHYLAHKAEVRQQLADGAMISIDQAKHCLLALLYGAKESSRQEDAIPSAIGREAAAALYALPAFEALSAEVGHARRAILDSWPRTANGSLTNAAGKAVPGSKPPAVQLAHLLQGAEAKALMAVVKMHPHDILLLQHDGFVARRRLDCGAIEEAVLHQLGYRLGVEEKLLELHPEPRALSIRTKSETAREALPELDFESVSAD